MTKSLLVEMQSGPSLSPNNEVLAPEPAVLLTPVFYGAKENALLMSISVLKPDGGTQRYELQMAGTTGKVVLKDRSRAVTPALLLEKPDVDQSAAAETEA